MINLKTAALLLAGSLFLCGCGGTLPRGATVNGLNVGGLTRAEAAAAVRGTLPRTPLTIRTPKGDYRPALDYFDDADEVLSRIRKKGNYTVTGGRRWIDAEEYLDMVCRENAKEPKDASLTFGKEGFCYFEGENGFACDYQKLLEDTMSAIESEKSEVTLVRREIPPKETEETLRARTRLLSCFSTSFNGGNLSRAENIRLAAARLSGTTLEPGGSLSFNEIAGARTRENGYLEAPVIADGEYVLGVGGGVCQASTTLFGAALRAGLRTESRPHSLRVGYVPPSQDAMVSSSSDLTIVNPHPFPVYILAETDENAVTFCIYGKPDGTVYEVESKILRYTDPPPEIVREGEEDRVIRAEKRGMESESWLVRRDGAGRELARTLIRRDVYAPVQGVRERAPVLFDLCLP